MNNESKPQNEPFFRKEWILLVASILITLVLTVTGIRWFAPQLLGLPMDLRLVKTAKEVPPFFDGIFRVEDYNNSNFIIDDPFVIRAKPLFPDTGGKGPNDIMGFRNRSIPNYPDVIIIGDSQTYGNNAVLEQNWPSFFAARLNNKQAVTYNMSVGGWAAPQYFEIFSKATFFRPRLVVVAFYTGNDPQESFIHTYGNDRWAYLRPNNDITAKDAVKGTLPVPESQWWPVTFKDNFKTIFTPAHRYISNMDHPSVHAGYEIIARVAEHIVTMAAESNIQIAFTIIPSKELVYANKVKAQGINARQDYLDLVTEERKKLDNLALKLQSLNNTVYIDVLGPLQKAALKDRPLYPSNINGHPIAAGYKIIGDTVAEGVKNILPNKPTGVISVQHSPNKTIYLIRNNKLWIFSSMKIFTQNHWETKSIKEVSSRDIANLPHGGVIRTANPDLFGPPEITTK